MKKFILIAALVFISIAGFSQDLISLKRGTRLEVIVTEITPTIVRYKLYSEPNGRSYFVYKDDVAGIMYRDGRVETFASPDNRKTESNLGDENRNEQQPNASVGNREKWEPIYQPTRSQNQTGNRVLPRGNKNNQDIIYLKNGSIIRGTIIEQVPNKSIKIETKEGNIFAYQTDDIDRIVKATAYNDNYQPRSSGLEKGYKGIIDFGYYYGIGDYTNINQLTFNFINGFQVNPYFSFGFGTGMHYYFDSESVLIPFFADFRVNFIDRAISPYVSFDIGYSFDASDDFRGVGIFINTTVGVSFKLAKSFEIHAGLGYQLQRFNYGNLYGSSYIDYGSLAPFKIGFSF